MFPQFLEKARVEAVLHFAASLLVGESVEEPRKYFWNNVVNTLRLLDAMLEAGVRRIVFSSSAAVYGNPQKVPIPEDHPKQPVNPYGETKLAMERALQWYGNAYGLKWVALRYFNAAGADPDGELGESHDPEVAPDSLDHPGRARAAAPRRDLRHGLPYPRRHCHPRLHSRHGFGRRPRAGAGIPRCGGRKPRPQPGDWPGVLRARGHQGGGENISPAGTFPRGAAARGRSTGVGRRCEPCR